MKIKGTFTYLVDKLDNFDSALLSSEIWNV